MLVRSARDVHGHAFTNRFVSAHELSKTHPFVGRLCRTDCVSLLSGTPHLSGGVSWTFTLVSHGIHPESLTRYQGRQVRFSAICA